MQPKHLKRLQAEIPSWSPELIGSLVYPLRNQTASTQDQQSEVLLIDKQRGHGQGLINGAGGKLEPNETIPQCAKRELYEEVGIEAEQLQLKARIRFVELNGPQWLGFVFIAARLRGTPSQSREAIPAWYNTNALPWERMWPSDRLWLPQVLNGEQLEVNLLFDNGRLLAKQIVC